MNTNMIIAIVTTTVSISFVFIYHSIMASLGMLLTTIA